MTATEIRQSQKGDRVIIRTPDLPYAIGGTIQKKINEGKNGVVVKADNGTHYVVTTTTTKKRDK
jgi:hypothetical protein